MGVEDAGGGVDVGMGVHARGDANQDILRFSRFSGNAVEEVEFVETVHHHPAYAAFDGL